MSYQADFIIVGAGIVGLSLAREVHRRHPKAKIIVLEKEPGTGRHASGRNSGVLHSGIFYSSDSIKAHVCKEGAKELRAFCEERKLPLYGGGKVILPMSTSDGGRMTELFNRGKTHGINVERIESKQLHQLEPFAQSMTGEALYLPNVAVIVPSTILDQLTKELIDEGVEIHFNHRVDRINPSQRTLEANQQSFTFGTLLNAAGLHAEEISKACGVGKDYTILPFKGYYYQLKSSRVQINRLIYALPDPEIPFLGIHTAKKPNGDVFFGPTVVPVFGRENYKGLEDIHATSALEIASMLIRLYLKNNQHFRKLVHREGLRFLKRFFFEQAVNLVPELKIEELIPSSHVGIRAQLVNVREKKLVLDFLIEKGENSIHVLNAVSPAFTSAFPFARMVLDRAGI